MSSLSNLPAGVTSREIDALCERFGGDPLFECAKCLQEVYEDDTPQFTVNGQLICYDCATTCALCGKWMADEDFPAKVIEVRFREWESDGKLSDAHCPQCAANWLIGGFIGDKTFDYDDYNTPELHDQMHRAIERAFPLPARVAA